MSILFCEANLLHCYSQYEGVFQLLFCKLQLVYCNNCEIIIIIKNSNGAVFLQNIGNYLIHAYILKYIGLLFEQ